MSGKYRILQKDFEDGRTIYVLEKTFDGNEWKSVVANADLEFIREAKQKRETEVVSQRVIE